MKKVKLLSVACLLMLFSPVITLAQVDSESSNFNAGADIFSNYIWRGSKFGSGPSFQPYVEFSTGGFALGVWGAFDAAGYTEADPYIAYSFPFGLGIGLTDYYFPGLPVFETSTEDGSHALELNVGYAYEGLGLSANYIFNEAGGAGSVGGDMYFQVGYDFPNVGFFIGAGDGWHTTDGEFQVVTLGVGTAKEIQITEYFSLPVSGQVIVNPDQEQLYLVVGFSL